MVNTPLVSLSGTTTLLGLNQGPFLGPTTLAATRDTFTGVTKRRPPNLHLSHLTPIKRRTERECTSVHQFGRRILAPRRSCSFAKSGKLRDPVASGRFVRVGKNRIRPNSSRPSPGAGVIQAITLGRPNEVTAWRVTCSLRLNN